MNTETKIGPAYISRRRELKRMGWNSYQDYLKSELWCSIRKKVFERKGKTCASATCNADAQCIHHTDYKVRTLEGKKLKGLIPLCNDCHLWIEFKGDQKVTSFKEIRARTKILLEEGRAIPFKKN